MTCCKGFTWQCAGAVAHLFKYASIAGGLVIVVALGPVKISIFTRLAYQYTKSLYMWVIKLKGRLNCPFLNRPTE